MANYIKPHFEIGLALDKKEFKTGEAVSGKLQLLYPDGEPVKNARVQLSLRAQQLSMVGNDLRYAGRFRCRWKAVKRFPTIMVMWR